MYRVKQRAPITDLDLLFQGNSQMLGRLRMDFKEHLII
jgi:hypothetical protein